MPMRNNHRSLELLGRAASLMPGGVNSPVRAFTSVGLPPPFIVRGHGCTIIDEDGNEFIDYVGSWGPLILGHAHPEVLESLRETMRLGTSFGAPTRREVELAELITQAVPSMEMVRLVNSGTEATMSAVRLARGWTRRDCIIKFAGCYHGHSDSLLAKAGSGAATFGVPDSMGVPQSVVAQTVVLPYNDLEAVRGFLEEHPKSVAAIIVEPVAGNMGVVPPEKGFLQGLREVCTRDGALLIFDEVMTGFRVAFGGAQALYGVKPDITCLGKIIGGGLPCAAFGASKGIMELLAPVGGVYQAGTLSGNPLAVTAGLTTLHILQRDNPYQMLEKRSQQLHNGIEAVFSEKGVPHTVNRVGSMLSVFFRPGPVASYADALKSNRELFQSFFARMIDQGIYLAPSPFEAWFVGVAHTKDVIDMTIEAARKSI